MKINFEKSVLCGEISAPPSKSIAHRMLIAAALSQGESIIHGISDSDDINATLKSIEALGAVYEKSGTSVKIIGCEISHRTPLYPLEVNESGSTLRFLIPICLLIGKKCTVKASEVLLNRPLGVYEKICEEKLLTFKKKDSTTLEICGPLSSGDFEIEADESSQFVSGLLFALPLLRYDSRIIIKGELESRPYVDMTIEVMSMFGVRALWQGKNTLFIPGNQKYKAGATYVEGDYSNAAFLLAFNYFKNNRVKVTGLREQSVQGDRACVDLFRQLSEKNREINVKDTPDLAPVLLAFSALQHGCTLTGTHRLKFKESDRGQSMKEELEKIGAKVELSCDMIKVYKRTCEAKCAFSCHGDHRIAMAMTLIAVMEGVSISGIESISKSMPEYYEILKSLGAKYTLGE